MVVLAGQAAVQHHRAVDLLHDPPLRLRDEAFALVCGVAVDDLDLDGQQGAVEENLVLEVVVHQGLLQTHPAPLGRLIEQGSADCVVMGGGGRHHDTGDQPQNMNGQSPLAPRHLLVGVQSRRGLRDTRGRADGLGVGDQQGRGL